ncbi:2-amino-4-hydroxy-6-hydroxymethyldihydropteridine diphosphokinase [Acidiphilium sp.]|uniref:2-amino-4-hydroxy-6- hydroxymethyldihydropteridine diphosphokinase n=1 Tax=Acidiphilium sp. TaxID=527 RepID=UPI003D02B074
MLLIAIGSNLPGANGESPRETCRAALEILRRTDGMAFVKISPWYRTRPIPRDDSQPDFCNGVARFEGRPDPAWLMATLHRIEASFGRVRSVANAARTLDLDVIDMNGMIRAEPSPTLPHPRAHLRAFVLQPLLDVAPEWVHPSLRRSCAQLLAALPNHDADFLVPW